MAVGWWYNFHEFQHHLGNVGSRRPSRTNWRGGRDPSVWPKKLTFQLFQGWFELEWGSEVFDLGRGEIERERMDG